MTQKMDYPKARKFNWRKRNLLERGTVSIKADEKAMKHDAAARWLEQHGRRDALNDLFPELGPVRANQIEKSRSLGTNPRALGTNPRALGTNPRAKR
jgi:hypothetical protein